MSEPDLVLDNGVVITLDHGSTIAEAVSIRHGRIAAVGPSAAIARDLAPGTRRIDLAGRVVVPGFFDAHPHVDRTGLRAGGGICIAGLGSIAEIADVVRRAARSAAPGTWIVLGPMGKSAQEYASGPEDFQEGRLPDRQDLDAVAPDNPVYVRATWGGWAHRPCPSVANSRALAEAGVTRHTQAPPNVEIVRNRQGEPTGLFLERNYAPLLEYSLFRMLPSFSHEDRVEAARRGSHVYAAAGTTSAFEGHGLTPAVISAYRELNAQAELPMRFHGPFSVPSAVCDDWKLAELFHHYAAAGTDVRADSRFRLEGIFLGGRGARGMLELVAAGYPYEQWTGHFFQSVGPARFVRLGLLGARLGLRMHRIATQDLEYALGGYEAIDREMPIGDRRWVMVHVSAATPSQLRRLKQLGVMVTVTPGVLAMAGAQADSEMVGDRGLLLRELLDAGIPVALGTSGVWPSMLWAMWAALRGWDERARSHLGQSWISREEALCLAVRSGHRLTWSEDRRGSIEVGKDADLAVLDGNPLTCREEQLRELSVDLTVVGGRIVHEAR